MNELCDYGCGNKAKYKFKNGKNCCSKNHKLCSSMRRKGVPDPTTKTKICKYCEIIVPYYSINRHENLCHLNPNNIKLCPNCSKPVRKGNKFCSSSCSASFNNKGRILSFETRIKISKSNNGSGKVKTINRNCLFCGGKLSTNRRFCDRQCKDNYDDIVLIKEWFEIPDKYCSRRTFMKKYFVEKYNNKCQKCGWSEINPFTNSIPLELHHIDGNLKNNNPSNFELLCPNCHSLTRTYKFGGRNVIMGH